MECHLPAVCWCLVPGQASIQRIKDQVGRGRGRGGCSCTTACTALTARHQPGNGDKQTICMKSYQLSRFLIHVRKIHSLIIQYVLVDIMFIVGRVKNIYLISLYISVPESQSLDSVVSVVGWCSAQCDDGPQPQPCQHQHTAG